METLPLSCCCCCGLKLILFLVHLAVVVLWLKDDVSTEAVFSTDRASVPAPDDEEDDVGVGALLFVVRLVSCGDGTTNPPFLVPSSPAVDECAVGAQSVRVRRSERRPIPTPLRSEKLALMLLFALDDEDDTIAVVVAPAALAVEFIVVVSVVAEVLLVVVMVVMVVKDGIAAGSGGGGGTTLVLDGTGFLLFTMLLWWKNS